MYWEDDGSAFPTQSVQLKKKIQNIYRPLTKLLEGNVFTGVCLSFCSGGMSMSPVMTTWCN